MRNSSADVASAHPGPGHPAPTPASDAGNGSVPSPAILAARARFSSLNDDFIYLDAPGGTQTPDEVANAAAQVYLKASGNTGAPYATSRRLEALVDEARSGLRQVPRLHD